MKSLHSFIADNEIEGYIVTEILFTSLYISTGYQPSFSRQTLGFALNEN